MQQIKLLFITGAAMLLTVSSCHIYRPYSRPDVQANGLYRDSLVEGCDSNSIANLGWQQLFKDPDLQNLLREALQNNTDLRAALLSVEQAEVQYTQSKADFFPSLSLGGNGNLSKGDDRTSRTYSGMLNASWEIDFFGKLLNAKRGARAALLQSEAYQRAVQTRLISTVATYYYTLLMLDEQLRISEQTLVKWTESVETMKIMKQAGMVNEAAVVQSEANRYGVETTLPELRRQIRETENALSVLLARPAGQIRRTTLADQQFNEAMVTGVSSLLLANRPDVQAAENALMIAYANTNIARAQLYPSIVISGSGGYSNSVLGAVLNPAQLLGSLAGGLTLPLFSGPVLRTRLKVMKAEQQKAVLSFQQSLLNAGAEVSDALFHYNNMGIKLQSREKQIASLVRSVEVTQQLLRFSSSTYLEVITAQQSLLSAQISQVSDRYQQIQSVINLYAALGGGSK